MSAIRPIFQDDGTVYDPATGKIRSLNHPAAPEIDAPMVDWALFYARHGWPVFPCDGKKPLTARDKDANGEPIDGTGGFYKASTDEAQIRAWWKKWPDALIAIRAGEASGVFAIDPDGAVGMANWSDIVAKHGTLPQTHTHNTPGGGQHLIFRWRGDRPITTSPGQLKGLKIDVKGQGGYFIAPPSRKENGKRYQVADQANFFTFAEAPEWLYALLHKPEESIEGQADLVRPRDGFDDLIEGPRVAGQNTAYIDGLVRRVSDDLIGMPPGDGRNRKLNDAACRLGHFVASGELNEQRAVDELLAACAGNAVLKDDGKAQCLATIRSGLRKGKQDPQWAPERTMRTEPTADNVIPFNGAVDPTKPAPAQRKPIRATPYVWKDPATIPMREWLYGRLLLRKFVSATISPGGIGKSSLIAAETMAMVSGKDLLGVKPDGPLRVWVWNLEDPQVETERKIQAVAIHYELEPHDIGDRLLVDSGRDQKLVIATTAKSGTTIVQPVVDELVDEIIRYQVDVLVIDPFVSCHEVAENDNSAMDMVVKEWGKVAERGNCAVHLVHHTRKPPGAEGETTTDSSRGASAQTDACRVVRPINRMTKEQAINVGIDNPRLYFRTSHDKSNLQPPVEKADWYKLVSVDLGNGPMGLPGDDIGVVTKWEMPEALAGMTAADFDRVAMVVRGGKWRENHQSKDWVGLAVAKALNLDADDKPTKGKIKRMLGAWYKASSLVVVDRLDDKRNLRKFVELSEG